MSGLARTLEGGVAQAVQRTLPASWPYSADEISGPVLGQAMRDLFVVRKAAGLSPAKADGALEALADELAARRPLLLTALFFPWLLPARLPELGGRSSADPVNGWLSCCWIAEAAWRALNGSLTDPQFAAGDGELLLPLAARLRFLALSEPMREQAGPDGLSAAEPDGPPGGMVMRVFGTGSWHLLVGRCYESRRAWLGYLDTYQSRPFLAYARPSEIDQEIRAVVFRRGRGAPLGLSIASPDVVPLTAEDKTVIDEVTDRHLLPRFDLRSVLSLAAYGPRARIDGPRLALGSAAVACGLAAVACAALLRVQWAAALSVACYLWIGAGIGAFGPAWAAPWLLRLPAAAAVGVIALVGLMAGGWLGTPGAGLAATAAVVLVVAACGYLGVELRNHSVAGWALTRSLAVAAIGAVHALMVSLLGLVYVEPAFVPHGELLARLWHRPGYGRAGMLLLLATAWCLAVGVFSQILWDDRPITAPLAHLQWRSGQGGR
jgi:hypothetical protein